MAIKGTSSTATIEHTRKVGYGEFKVIKFNPTREELNEMLGIEDTEREEINYTSIDSEGYSKTNVSVWLESTKTKEKFNLRFTLVDKEVVGKNSGKNQYINNVGETSRAMEEGDLANWFTQFKDRNGSIVGEKQIRKAIVGEGNFYAFLRAWFNINFWSPDAELIIDKRKLFNGNFDELNLYLNSEITQTIVAMLCVRTVEGDEGIKEYQSVFNGAFLPGRMIKGLRMKSDNKQIKKFIENVSGEYGCTDYFSMEEMRDYVTGENLAASNERVVGDDDASY